MFPESNQPIDLKTDLINLATYRKDSRVAGNLPDPIIVLVAYAQDALLYNKGRIITSNPTTYATHKKSPNLQIRNALVNKFGLAYQRNMPLLMHRRLADVIIGTAIDLRDRYHQFTVVMDGLRTYEGAEAMQAHRPDLVASGMLAPAGASAHNRALAVDSKLFELIDPQSYETWHGNVPLSALVEADEHGHLDDEQDMLINSRFYTGPMSESARSNRHQRLVAWQRASVKNHTPIANLFAEFWDDRVPGSPADLWRILSCRALCIGMDANPTTNPHLQTLKTQLSVLHNNTTLTRNAFAQQAQTLLTQTWQNIFSTSAQIRLEALLGLGGGSPPPLNNYIFHEWLNTIHNRDISHFL